MFSHQVAIFMIYQNPDQSYFLQLQSLFIMNNLSMSLKANKIIYYLIIIGMCHIL